MTSASDWTFCWKLNAPASSSASSPQPKSKRKRPVSAPIPTQEKINNKTQSSNGSILIMDNIKLPFAETWCAAMPVEPKKRTAKSIPTKFHQTVTLGNQKIVKPNNRRQTIHAQQHRPDDQFIAGMMQRVELDLFPQDFIQRPAEHTGFPRNDLRRTQSHPADKYSQPQEIPNFTQTRRESLVEDDYLNLVATPESGGANISGDEYSPDVTPISTSDQSFLHFLNDETIPLEISGLMENAAFEVEVPSQDLFNCDPSWLNCFDP